MGRGEERKFQIPAPFKSLLVFLYDFLNLQLGHYAWMLYSLFCLEGNVALFQMMSSLMQRVLDFQFSCFMFC